MKFDHASQEQGHRTWSIVRLLYKALIEFRRQYDRYEEKVLDHARASGTHRDVLRLRPAELAALLDFKSLEELRDGYIHELKELCHEVYRTKDRTDPLDRYVSDVFHEISILKEEHYTVKTYAPMYEAAAAKVELQYILDEAHVMFPQKLRHILYLFGKARERLEEHLPTLCAKPIVIRSLYLNRDAFVRDAYPDGVRSFYRFMYAWGPLEGFYEAGLSFYHSGFFAQALEAFRMAEAEYPEALTQAGQAAAGIEPDRPTLHSIMRSLRAKIGRLAGLDAAAGSAERVA